MDFSKLDEGHDDGDDVHYYYDRQERISHAPKIVQDYYSGKFHPTGGLFKSLISTTGNKILLVCVLVCSAAVVYLHSTGDKPFRKHIGSVQMTLAAFNYGDEVYASITAKDEKASSSAAKEGGGQDSGFIDASNLIECHFSALDCNGEVVCEAAVAEAVQDGAAQLRVKFQDYDIVKVEAEVSYAGESKTLSMPVGEK